MVKISPKRLQGQWDEGFALDFHTISSTYVGDDEYGHPQFDTVRSAIGELLYQLKYGNDQSVMEAITATASSFVRSKSWCIDVVIPVPASRYRSFQPVVGLAKQLAEDLGVAFGGGHVVKTRNIPELKNVFDFDARAKLLADAFQVDRTKVEARHVLLFDDLYRSGATMNAVSHVLKASGKAAKVYVLALTMTRKHR